MIDEHVASVFMSYNHNDRPLAQALKQGLDRSGCRVWIDEGELLVGDVLIDKISGALDQVDFLVALVSEHSVGSDWCRKEVSIAMTGEINRRGITVLPLRIGQVTMPPNLVDKVFLPVQRTKVDAAVDGLMRSIRGHLTPSQPLPSRRRPPSRSAAPTQAGPPSGEPLRLAGVDEAGVTRPAGDGTRGSALYAVPFRLSGAPDSLWSQLLVQNWDRPASFGSMHRPGIARVVGSRIILDGTTIEEVERYHLATLKLAVDATNAGRAAQREQERQHREAQDHQRLQHEAAVQLSLQRLDFG